MPCCSAPNCARKPENGYRVFRFPTDPERRKKWVNNMRRDAWTPTNSSRMCEVHFEDSQWEKNREDGRILLKSTAVPTLFDVPNLPPRLDPKPRKSLYKPPVPLVTLVKTEPPEEALEEEISTDVKEDIDIVYYPLCEDIIKNETVLEDILENKHLECLQTQALVVKTENSPFIKIENITKRIKSEDTSDGNLSKSTGQGVVEVQVSHEHSYALCKLETDEQSVFNFSETLNDVRSRKSKSPKKTDFLECYKTDDTTLREKEKEEIKVIKAPVIPVEVHEYTSLVNGKHVCNHCQRASNTLRDLKRHIEKIHREVTTMYQCLYCPYKSKWKHYIIKEHIIQKHKDTKDIQWFQCHLCEMKFKLKGPLTRHMKVHLTHEQMQYGLDLKRHHCDKCNYKTDRSTNLKNHNLIHLKPEEIEYFYCYHCSYKSKEKKFLKSHIFTHHFKNVKHGKRHHCDKCDYKTDRSTSLKSHKLTHLKPEEIQYLYCYHCSYKSKRKSNLKRHIFRHHSKNVKQGKRHHCDKCDYKTYSSTTLKVNIFYYV